MPLQLRTLFSSAILLSLSTIPVLAQTIQLPTISDKQAAPAAPAQPAASATSATPAQLAASSQTVAQPQTAVAEDNHGNIKVHGHWIVDALNEDGSVEQHRDYQNSLYPAQGENSLLYLLTGQFAPSAFGAYLENGFGYQFDILPAGTTFTNGLCLLTNSVACFTNEAQVFQAGTTPQLTLQGTITEPNFSAADQDYYSGTFLAGCTDRTLTGAVATISSATVTAVSPRTCASFVDGQALPPSVVGMRLALTSHQFSPAITVQPNQHVMLSVALTFN